VSNLANERESQSSKMPTLIGVALAAALIPLGITVGGVSLETIGRDLDATFSQLQWVINGYNLTLSAFLLTSGSMADLFGRRKILVLGLIIHSIGALMAGLAPTALVLDIFRAVQGVGGAMLLASAPAILANEFTGRTERAKAFGVLGASFGIGLILGPMLGGVVTETFGWRYSFLMAVPVGILILLFAAPKMRPSKNPDGGRIDWPGLFTFTGALFLLMLAIIEGPVRGWTSVQILTNFAASGLLIIGFLVVENNRDGAMFELSLFKNSNYAGANIIAVLSNLNLVAMLTFLPLYLQVTAGLTAGESGLAILPYTGFLFVAPYVTGVLAAKISARFLVTVGLILTATGSYVMTGFNGGGDWQVLIAGAALAGIGVGMVMGLNDNIAVSAAPPEKSGMANGMFNTNRILGDSIAVAGAGAILFSVVLSQFPSLLSISAPELASQASNLADQVVRGNLQGATSGLSAETALIVKTAAITSFSGAFNILLWVLTAVASLGALVSMMTLRADHHQQNAGEEATSAVND